jgi:glycosyltransferase involved in cell wall biosynthesis
MHSHDYRIASPNPIELQKRNTRETFVPRPVTVSVVIPTYNYAHYLPRAIESAINQTYSPLEIIVVDDASTDQTPDILKAYGSRITVVRKENNEGPTKARNLGLTAVSGDLIAFLDSDDEWKPQKLEKQVAAFHRDPAAGVIGCGVEVVFGDSSAVKRLVELDIVGTPRQRVSALALRRAWVGGSLSGALIPKNVLLAVQGFDESLMAAEDWDLWLRIGERYMIRNVSDILVTIHSHGTGTFRNPERAELNQTAVMQKTLQRSGHLIDWATRRRLKALIKIDAAGEYYHQQNWRAMTKSSAQAILFWPLHMFSWRMLFSGLARSLTELSHR